MLGESILYLQKGKEIKMASTILRALTKDGSARIFVINSKDIVNKAQKLHNTLPTATAALGRVLTATSMMGCMLKNKGNSVTVRIKGEGETGSILAVADYFGNVKGYIDNPLADPPRRHDGKLNVGAAVGGGTLSVIKDEGLEHPYIGVVNLVSGEIAEDITAYFSESEQIPTLCALGVLVDKDYSCKAAGGIIVQLLPFADDKVISALENNAKNLVNISNLFDEGKSNEEIAKIALGDIEFDVFDEIDVDYVCDCSYERMGMALLTLKPVELYNILVEDGKIETQCHFCNKKYTYKGEDIERFRKLKEERLKNQPEK